MRWGGDPGPRPALQVQPPAPIYTQGITKMDRLGKLKDLESRLLASMDECDIRSLAALARQYRETLAEIEQIEGDQGSDDDIARILSKRADLGKAGAVRKNLS